MKRLLSVFLLTLGISASARQITSEEALGFASDFMKSAELQTAGTATKSLRPMKAPGVDSNVSVSPYYVFNRGENEGFIIISGDDRAPKILGYSDKGSFDAENLPPQLKAMMEQWSVQMANLLESLPQHASWSRVPATRAEDGVLLETANWGQGFPYNASCPIVEGANCVTGCVATAMAIVMKYNNWPETYDWASMPMNTEKDPLDYEVFNSALAGLMADAGEAVKMQYSPWESGASMNWVGHKLQQDFRYSPECQYITSANFEESEWLNLLRSNIDEGFPVIYSGSGFENHAFVIDGYNSVGYHVNWGWDGLYNGYFAINSLTPNEYQDFSMHTGMAMNIIPDHSGIEYSKCFADHGYFWNGGDIGDKMNISVEEIRSGEEFSVIWKYITMPEGFKGEIGIALVDANGKIKEILQTNEASSEYYEGIGYFEGIFLGNVAAGTVDADDRLQLIAKENSDEEYKIILGTLENPSYAPVNGNTPKKSNVTIKVGEGVYFDHTDMAANSGILPYGESNISIMNGLHLYYRVRSEDSNSSNPVVMKVEGELLYGTIHVSSKDEINYWIDVASDCKIEAYIANLKDKEVDLNTPGTLHTMISEEDGPHIRNLKISGKMDARDFWYIRDNMPSLETLDLGKATIEEVTGGDGNFIPDGDTYYANCIPGWALTNLHSSYISNLILPPDLVEIGSDALVNLDISSITIPENVNSIGINVFYACDDLKVVELLNPEPVHINDCIFLDTHCPNEGILYVPEGSASKYKQTPVWQDFKEIIEGRMPVSVNEIQLSPNNWIGEEGESFKIEATVLPENATDKILTWTSSDEAVATVDADGNVTVLKEGTCVITATAADGSGVAAECLITSAAGVDGIFSEDESFDVYGLDGILVKKDADREVLKGLTKGVYVLRQGDGIRKIVIR